MDDFLELTRQVAIWTPVRNSSTSKTILVSDPASRLIRPVGCPGGRFIVFVWTNHKGNKKTNIWRVDIDGSNPKQLISGEIDVAGTCSLDEKWVHYQSYDSLRAFRVSIDGGTPEEVPGSHALMNLADIAVSLDGKFLTFFRSGKDPGTGGKIRRNS